MKDLVKRLDDLQQQEEKIIWELVTINKEHATIIQEQQSMVEATPTTNDVFSKASGIEGQWIKKENI